MAKSLDYKVVTNIEPRTLVQEAVVLEEIDNQSLISIVNCPPKLFNITRSLARPWEADKIRQQEGNYTEQELGNIYEETMAEYQKLLESS